MPNGTMCAMDYARRVFFEQCRAEWAGLFWIGAELAILFAVITAHRHVYARLHPDAPPRRVAWLVAAGAAAFVLLAAASQARHLWWTPVHLRLAAGALPGPSLLGAAYRFQNHAHYGLWAAFTVAWVLLEICIVFQGWRVCQGLRTLLTRPRGVAVALLLLGAALSWPAVAEEGALLAALHAEDTADVLYRNALGLWLRAAGVVWICAEWIAAVLLWRTYRLLRHAEDRHA